MARTTILADDALLLEARQLASKRGITSTAVVREALRAYLDANRESRRPSFTGLGRSGRSDVAGRDEELLAEACDRVEGWGKPIPRRDP